MAKVFFDFDGVLVQSRFSDKTFLWSKDLERDIKVTSAVREVLFRQPEWGEIISGRGDFRQRIEVTLRHCGLPVAVEEFIDYWLSHDLHWRRDILAVASKLKEAGHELYVATNQDKIRSSYIGKQEEVTGLFKGLFSSCDLGITKLNPAFYQKIQNQNFSEPNEMFLLLDDDERNVAAAKTVGWEAIYFNPDLDAAHSAVNLARLLEAVLRIPRSEIEGK